MLVVWYNIDVMSCMFACRESGVIEDDSISGEFDNFPEGKVRHVKIQEKYKPNPVLGVHGNLRMSEGF